MKCLTELPSGYQEVLHLDIQKDKGVAIVINGVGLIFFVVLLAIGVQIAPIQTVKFGMETLVLFLGILVYIIAHELVHGISMKLYGSRTVHYGYSGLFLYAGSQDYFFKREYIRITLAPVVFLGLILLFLNVWMGSAWFWGIYFVQVINLSGAVGDFYLAGRFSRLGSDILVRDTGVTVTAYAYVKSKAEECPVHHRELPEGDGEARDDIWT